MFMFKMLKQPPEVFYKKSVLRVLVKFTEKKVCQSLFLRKLQPQSEYGKMQTSKNFVFGHFSRSVQS